MSNALCCFFITFCLAIYGDQKELKLAKKEAEQLAKEFSQKKESSFIKESDIETFIQDLLPEKDKGKKFNPDEKKEPSEELNFLASSCKKEELEGTESFLVMSREILRNPEAHIGATTIEQSIEPEEEKIQTCQESGTYRVSILQQLNVTVIPEVKKTVRHCNGHKKSEKFFWKGDAKKWIEEKKKSFSKKENIADYEAYISSGGILEEYKAVVKWTHTNDADSCDHYEMKEKVIEPVKEIDRWEASNPEQLTWVETTPFCRMLHTTTTQGAETRVIDGRSVRRDLWGRELFFYCEPGGESPCVKLRELGGVLVSRKCLQKNEEGECALWEKSYDLGKKGSFDHRKIAFKQSEEIWGLTNEFELQASKSTDFGQSISVLSVFADMKEGLEEKGSDFNENLEIFGGEKRKCQKSFLAGNVFDCCRSMEGAAVATKLATCSDEEKCLAKQRNEGKCHFIGSHKVKLGTIAEHQFCCFQSKLARVLHEQGRKQLNLGWGSVESPKCRGLSLKELQRIDFTKLDLAEVAEEYQMRRSDFTKAITSNLEQLQTRVKETIQKKQDSEKIGGHHVAN